MDNLFGFNFDKNHETVELKLVELFKGVSSIFIFSSAILQGVEEGVITEEGEEMSKLVASLSSDLSSKMYDEFYGKFKLEAEKYSKDVVKEVKRVMENLEDTDGRMH